MSLTSYQAAPPRDLVLVITDRIQRMQAEFLHLFMHPAARSFPHQLQLTSSFTAAATRKSAASNRTPAADEPQQPSAQNRS